LGPGTSLPSFRRLQQQQQQQAAKLINQSCDGLLNALQSALEMR
jgi:hypothetical protein